MIPKVSVIVPIYNVEKFLPRSVDAIRNQTLKDIEIILVDDESPDNCPQMCDEYKKNDNRIKVIHKKNGGLGYARNSGLDVATGEYVLFVDSDDYIDYDMLEIMYSTAKSHNVDFVRVDNYKETMDGKILNSNYVPPLREGLYNQQELRNDLLYPQFGMGPNDNGNKYVSCSVWRNLYKKDIIDTNKIRFVSERELISEDIPFNLEFMMNCKSAFVINRKFYHYIVNDTSLTQTYKADRFEKELILYKELCKRLKKYNIYDKCEVRIKRHLLTRARKSIRRELIGNPDSKLAKKNVKKILETNELRKVMDSYNYKGLPVKYRMVFLAMKYKCVNILWIIRNKL